MTHIPSEKELLALLDKSVKEQENYLACNKIQKSTNCFSVCCPDCDYSWDEDVYESLPDLADRLWKKATPHYIYYCSPHEEKFYDILKIVSEKTIYPDGKTKLSNGKNWLAGWFLYDARPIHRIVAALIALKMAGVEI